MCDGQKVVSTAPRACHKASLWNLSSKVLIALYTGYTIKKNHDRYFSFLKINIKLKMDDKPIIVSTFVSNKHIFLKLQAF